MMRNSLLILTILSAIFMQCKEPMSREDVVKAMKFCEANGYEPHFYGTLSDDTIIAVQCHPKRKEDRK